MSVVRLSAVVPTLGLSRWLLPCLEALRRDGGDRLEILLVDQGRTPSSLPAGLVDQVLRPARNLGFAAANNRAFAMARGAFLATVNDDAVVDPGWSAALLAALEADDGAAAAQGVVRRFEPPARVDGRGLAWNRAWQAVQIDHDQPLEVDADGRQGAPRREVFGVSATAAIFRRSALATLGGGDPSRAFDEALGSYYEDVELACRLRHAGWRAWSVAAAGARHVGSVSGRRLGLGSRPRIYGNRLLVLARLFGSGFWPRLPRLLGRDLRDLARAALAARGVEAAGIVAGWGRALRLLPRFARRGAPLVATAELRRFQVPA